MENEPKNETLSGGEKQIGSFVGLLIILVLIIIGGLYFWGERLAKDNLGKNNSGETTSGQVKNSSDTASAIEADLNTTSTDNFDSDVKALGEEVQ